MNKQLKNYLRVFLPRRVHPHRILRGPIKGKKIVTSWYDYPAAILGYTELPLLNWFQRNVKLGETWLDIGAHYGYTAIALSELVGKKGRVFAFEPMLSSAGAITKTRRINQLSQLIVIPFGLGNTTNDIELEELPTTRGMADSTLQKTEGWVETLLVTRLDKIWVQISRDNKKIDGVKIDVQGMELETIRGMSELLDTYKPNLIVEFHKGVNRNDILTLIESLGYQRIATPIEPVGGETEPRYLDDRSYVFNPIK